MTPILQTLQEEFHDAIARTEKSTVRDYRFPAAKNMIKVAIGMRRSGKTYFLYQTIRQHLSEGIPLEHILYLNFEDDRLFPMTHKEMGQLIDQWYTLHPQNHNACCYLFLDEVQNIEGWPLVLRRLLDTKNIQIYVTGSSSKLLSKEIATALRGRSLAIEILPYSYSEFLSAHQLEYPSKPFGKKAFDIQRGQFLTYLKNGGFPAVQTMLPNEHIETLQSYVETVIFRDIIERHNIENISLLKYFIQCLLKNIAAPLSINKFHNAIKSQGFKAGKDTLYNYLDYLEDAFLIFPVPIFTESLRQSQTTSKKIYAIDNGLALANSFKLDEDLGKLFENQIHLTLRRQGKQIFYYRTAKGHEIDFITQDAQGKLELIQVAWETDSPQTLEREERALKDAEQELGIPGKLITCHSFLQSL